MEARENHNRFHLSFFDLFCFFATFHHRPFSVAQTLACGDSDHGHYTYNTHLNMLLSHIQGGSAADQNNFVAKDF